MVIKDLLGPAGGETEEISERNVVDRYCVGVLGAAKQLQPAPSTPPAGETARNGSSRVQEGFDEDYDDPIGTTSLNDELADGGKDSSDDGLTDQDVPTARTHLPSSFGMTFCVDGDARTIRAGAFWGQYGKIRKEGQTDPRTGKPVSIWKRQGRGGWIDVPLHPGEIALRVPDAECPDVFIKGQVRQRAGHFIVTLFLVNGQTEARPHRDRFCLFQPELRVTGSPEGTPVFKKKSSRVAASKDPVIHLEEERMAMLYRGQVEFAVGHGVSVHAEADAHDHERAVLIRTCVVPRHEVPRTTPPSAADAPLNAAFGQLAGLELDMKALAEITRPEELGRKLAPLTDAYRAWIAAEAAKLADPAERLAGYLVAGPAAIAHCRATLGRIEEGLALLASDAQAAEAFRFMNRAMWLQRTHSLYAERVRRGERPDFDRDIDEPKNRTWFPFQLAFILLNLPGITRLDHAERGESQDATADLLFFPTGGGKTEAYLGLSAYTMGLRRLQGPVAGRSGENGVAVLMRYTLRLLTIQQFQRATALVCACESIRRQALEKGDTRWGHTPFRIGLWVGRRTTPNTTDASAEAIIQLRGNQPGQGFVGGTGSPYQLTACPWCGSANEAGRHLEARTFKQGAGRTLAFCGDQTGQCLFSRRQAPDEGLPVVVVDEEIYRRLPTLLIATVDKFAQMPWKGEAQMLFGQVNGFCQRHGFRSPDLNDSDSHPKTPGGLPAAKTVDQNPLRPPDLIIQDELHLISGPLGTLVGLYETAVDELCAWEVNGRRVRPKLVASTATIRNAESQVHSLFLRRLNLFPPPGLDVGDNFFSLQRAPSEAHPGRLYLGICAPGRRLKAALIRVYVALLCASQALYEEQGRAADPWMTLVGYFNSMRELGGMRRLVDDDVFTRCKKMDRRGLAKRFFSTNYLEELTSRMRSEEIPQTLDRLETVFDPDTDARRKELSKSKEWKNAPKKPIDVLLATNMISVGVDVKRLGLMVVAGQPKATAEYIQATSRVGRNKPGLVVTVFNWARPRDLSHYESFEHYHATFYKQVEALSVTPFSPGALRRGLAGLLVSLVRLGGVEFNPNGSAGKIQMTDPRVQAAIELIARRAELIGDGVVTGNEVRATLKAKLDLWKAEAQNVAGGRTLSYTEPRASQGLSRGTTVPLLQRPGLQRWEEFTCLNSLRDVEPTVKLVLNDGGLDEAAPSGARAGTLIEGGEPQP